MRTAQSSAIAVAILLAGCAAAPGGEAFPGEAAGRRVEVVTVEGRSAPTVCVEPQRDATGAVQPSKPDPDTLGPPPFGLLQDGPFLICRALQAGALSADGYRAASLDYGATLLRAQATAGLLRIGARDDATVAELRAWHRESAFLRIGCIAAARLAASGAEQVDPDILTYCGALRAAAAARSDVLP